MPEASTYDDGYGDSEADEIVDNVARIVRENGPCVVERIVCHHCGHVELAVHPFVESMECGGCGKRNPSSVPRYPELHKSSDLL